MRLFDIFWSAAKTLSGFRYSVPLIALLALAGCKDEYSNSPAQSGPTSTLVVSRSASGTINAMSGQTRTLTLTFNSSGAAALTNLVVTTDLARLPSGWAAPSSFSCALVSAGRECVLNLSYSPTAYSSGDFAIEFSYLDDQGANKSGRETISYAATTDNNVVAAAAPSGQVNAIVAGTQPVTVSFTTDDGSPASALQLVTRLDTLPAGWTSPVQQFACATVSTGNGCLLPLNFAPATRGGGTLALQYSYLSNAGVAKTGAVEIVYSATTHNNIVSTVFPAGQVAAVLGSHKVITVAFAVDDGNPISDLAVTTDLARLPAGWSASAPTFSCSSVSLGQVCELPLTFSPTVPASGTLSLSYSYRDDSGAAKSGLLDIGYKATTLNNVAATVSPALPVRAAVGSTQNVTFTFTTDDGLPARLFQLTSDLSTLPAGWSSSATTFACASVDGTNSCSLGLSYAPTAVSSGNFVLTYDYLDNSDNNRTGSVTVVYSGSMHNSMVAQANPASVSLELGQSRSLSVTFTTSDGNAANDLVITSGLSSLPSGWSSTSGGTFSCNTVTTGNTCQLNLSYEPTAERSATTLSLGYSYVDNAGSAANGIVTIPYSATARTLYVSNYSPDTDYLLMCDILANGDLAPCTRTHAPSYDLAQEITNITDIDYRNGKLVFTQTHRSSNSTPLIRRATLDSDGGITFMYGLGSPVADPRTITLDPAAAYAYVMNATGDAAYCKLGTSGFSTCDPLSVPQFYENVILSPDGTVAYAAYANGVGTWTIDMCLVGSDGTLASCGQIGTGNMTKLLAVIGNRLYAKDTFGGLDVCPINREVLGTCVHTATSEPSITDAVFTATNVYLSMQDATLHRCPLNADGTLGTCVTLSDPDFRVTSGLALR